MLRHSQCSYFFILFMQLLPSLSSSDAGYKYEVHIFSKVEARRSNLSCFHCYNGDNSDCMGLSDIHKVPTSNCYVNEPYCKVRRLSINGQLTTFDRYCATECTPGCHEGGLYSECVSCCNHRSYCNMDNSAKTSHPEVFLLPALLSSFFLSQWAYSDLTLN